MLELMNIIHVKMNIYHKTQNHISGTPIISCKRSAKS